MPLTVWGTFTTENIYIGAYELKTYYMVPI